MSSPYCRRLAIFGIFALCVGCVRCQDKVKVAANRPAAIQRQCASQSGWSLLQTKRSLTQLAGESGEVAEKHFVNAISATSNSSEPIADPAPSALHRTVKKLRTLHNISTWSDVRKNSAGDLSALLMTICWCIMGLAVCLLIFDQLRIGYPLIYENNVLNDIAPFAPSSAHRGWWHASMRLELDDVADAVGLDQAMLLELLHMCIRLLVLISPPMICMCFLHAFFGQMPPVDDGLGRIDLANIGPNSWLCWLHAGLVWYVVVTCHSTITKARVAFMPRRIRWLKELPFPRSTSILVEVIPLSIRTDAGLQKYFEEIFEPSGGVQSSTIVKHTGKLAAVVESLTSARQLLRQAEFAHDADAIGLTASKVQTLEWEVCSEQARCKREVAAGNPDIYSTTGFVTFKNRRDRETALCLRCTRSQQEIVVSLPPDPSDIYFQDLQVDVTTKYYWRIVGNALIVLLFIVFLPICIAIASIARLQTLQHYIPVLHNIVVGFPILKSAWDGLMASTILSCMLGFVPGMLTSIFQWHCLKTRSRVEHYIQVWHFYFLIVFVLFVTVIGNSLLETVVNAVATTHSLLHQVATNLPMASHFYIQYLVVQSFSYGLCLLRPVQLATFISWRKVCDDETARKLAEPEHDVYNSMGARSAMFAFHIVLALVFSSITPVICIVALASFVLARAFYGYLVVFAEPRVPDMGGQYWFTALGHVQQGIFIYILLMSAIVANRSSSWMPPVITLSVLFYHFTKYREFQHCFKHWDQLPVEDMPQDANVNASSPSAVVECVCAPPYLQPELQ